MYEQKIKRRVTVSIDTRKIIGLQNGRRIYSEVGGLEKKYGWFVGYGLALRDTGENVINYTCAIVEFDDGTAGLIELDIIKFVAREEQ